LGEIAEAAADDYEGFIATSVAEPGRITDALQFQHNHGLVDDDPRIVAQRRMARLTVEDLECGDLPEDFLLDDRCVGSSTSIRLGR